MLKNFENRDGWIWYDGKFVEWNNAKTHVISQGLHYASAVFEGERAYNGKIFKSEEHTKRFFKSAQTVGIKIPFTENEINNAKDIVTSQSKKISNGITEQYKKAENSISKSNTFAGIKDNLKGVTNTTGKFAENNSGIAKIIFIVFIKS